MAQPIAPPQSHQVDIRALMEANKAVSMDILQRTRAQQTTLDRKSPAGRVTAFAYVAIVAVYNLLCAIVNQVYRRSVNTEEEFEAWKENAIAPHIQSLKDAFEKLETIHIE